MNLEFYIFNDLEHKQKNQIANLVATYTRGGFGETPQMLPLEPPDVINKYLGIVAFSNQTFTGYIGAATPHPHNSASMSEVGSLWVPSPYRKQGVAHRLVSKISALIVEHDLKPYAFCNPLSKKIFEDSGYRQAGREDIPASAFRACADCPAKPESKDGCCDKTLIYEELR